MKEFMVHRSTLKYLNDKDLSLNAKGFLSIVLFSEELPALDIQKYCSDNIQTIKDTLLELRIAKYVKYDKETKTLFAGPEPYPEWDDVIIKDIQKKANKRNKQNAEQER